MNGFERVTFRCQIAKKKNRGGSFNSQLGPLRDWFTPCYIMDTGVKYVPPYFPFASKCFSGPGTVRVVLCYMDISG
jgi:hypothetical protein